MPRRKETVNEEDNENELKTHPKYNLENEDDVVTRLNRMLAAVMKYISDDEIVEIDIEYLLDHTEGLRKWWNEYREKDRKRVEEDIRKSLSGLSLEELEKIREQIQANGSDS